MSLNSFLHKKFLSTIKKTQLLPPKSSLLVAFSGGQDSLTLMKLLIDFNCIYNWKITLIHFDHRWRSDSMRASKEVFNCARVYKIPLYYFECPEHLKAEESSRRWRYAALIDVARKNSFSRILLAHTATDKSETLLSNLCRGTSLDGLSSIPFSSKISNSVYIVRPLLNFYRYETTWFCRKYFLPVWVDTSNYDYSMSRNRLRQELLPYIKSYFQPNFEERCYSLSTSITLETDFLEQEAWRINFYNQHQELVAINYLLLKLVHLSIQSRILKLFFAFNLGFKLNSKQISDIIIFINHSTLPSINIKNYIVAIDGIWFYVGTKK